MAKAKTPSPATSSAGDSAPDTAASPSQIVPRITLQRATAYFGGRWPAGTVMSFADPAHQRMLTMLVSRINGASIEFVPANADPAQDSTARVAAIAQTQREIDGHMKTLADIEESRRAEIKGLEEQRQAIIDTVRKESSAVTGLGLTPEKQIAAFLVTDEGRGLAAERSRIEARIQAVTDSIAAAKEGTDSTLRVSMSNSAIKAAKKRLAVLQPPVTAAPAVQSTGPTVPAGAAAT